MSIYNYIIREKFHNCGRQAITQRIDGLVRDAFQSVKKIESLRALEDDVGAVIRDLMEYMIDENDDMDIVNFKVVANENNNDRDTLPLTLDVIYRHKDSIFPTTLRYRILPPPVDTSPDKFAIWKKP